MKKSLIAVLLGASLLGACTRVEPGHVGIKVNNWGASSGVDNQSYGVGYYWTFMTGSQYYEYPIFTNTYAWTAKTDEGHPNNESMNFADKSGLAVNADVSVAYHVDAVKAPILFQKYRMNMDGIISGPLRNAVRNALVEHASSMAVEDIYGAKKADLINAAQADVQKQFAQYGLIVDQLYWASNIHLPPTIQAQINARIANEQEALAAKANVATVTAQAESRIAEARGKAEAAKLEASAISTNPEILQQRAIEKWDGHLPEYLTKDTALPFIGNTVK